MRRVAVAALLVAITCATHAIAGGGTHDVTTNAVKLLAAPSHGRASGQEWAATNAYSQGESVRVGVTRYMALVAGTSGTTAPAGDADLADGTVTWRHATRAPRSGLWLANAGSTDVILSWTQTMAAAGAGINLAAGEKLVWSAPSAVPQAPVFAASDSGTNTVYVYEW